MTEQSNAELIADARQLIRHSSVSVPEHANMLGRLADALEASTEEIEHLNAVIDGEARRWAGTRSQGVAGRGDGNMTTIDTTRLRVLAEAATPGPWVAGETTDWDGAPQASVNSSGTPITWDDHGGEVFKPEDAAYLAAIDPPTLIALLDRLDAAREYIDDPGNWSALDGRRRLLLAILDGKERNDD